MAKLTKAENKLVSKALEALEQLKELLEQRVEERNDVFDSRSEKWQESEKGDEYYEETSSLEDMVQEIDDTIDSLNEYVEYE